MGIHVMISKHKSIMSIVVLLTRDPQLSKSISVVDKIVNSYLITNVIAWLWNNQFGLYYQIMIDFLAI